MNKVFIFDVDGTLTPSRLQMTEKFKKFFQEDSDLKFECNSLDKFTEKFEVTPKENRKEQ